jgi:fumarate hydratase subunit beta
MMATHHITLPASAEDIEGLSMGDIVYLTGDITVTGGLPAHKRMIEYLDTGKAMPFPLESSFLHLPHMVEPIEGTGDYTIHYVNPTTSMRFDAYMPQLVRDLRLKIIGGKGGVGPATVAAMKDMGCVYLTLLGGGSPIFSSAIRKVVNVAWDDFPTHFRLSRLHVEELGPLSVSIDARGNSLFETLAVQARERIPAVLAQLERRRNEAASDQPKS